MKKKTTLIVVAAIALLVLISIFSNVYAVTGEEVLNSTQATELVEIKESAKNNLNSLEEAEKLEALQKIRMNIVGSWGSINTLCGFTEGIARITLHIDDSLSKINKNLKDNKDDNEPEVWQCENVE